MSARSNTVRSGVSAGLDPARISRSAHAQTTRSSQSRSQTSRSERAARSQKTSRSENSSRNERRRTTRQSTPAREPRASKNRSSHPRTSNKCAPKVLRGSDRATQTRTSESHLSGTGASKRRLREDAVRTRQSSARQQFIRPQTTNIHALPQARRESGALRSTQVGEIRRREARDRRTSSLRSSRFARVGAILVALFIVGLIVFAVASSMKVFSVTEVKVDGVEHLTNEEMTNLTRVPEGADLLTVDTASIKNALKSNPWVSSVQVHRQFPHTLVVQIVERDISAVVEVTPQDSSEIQYWAISSDGIWLMQIPSEDSPDASKVSAQVYADAKAALRITNVAYGVAPVVGAPCTDSSVQNALKVVDGLSSPLMDEVTSVSAQDAANTVLTLNNGLQIAFGEAKDIRTKERVCLELLEKYPDQITYINVRVVDRPTWRGLSS